MLSALKGQASITCSLASVAACLSEATTELHTPFGPSYYNPGCSGSHYVEGQKHVQESLSLMLEANH